MKLTWNLTDKVLAELPSGAGQLDLHHTRPKIEGRDHGRTIFPDRKSTRLNTSPVCQSGVRAEG